MITVLTLPASFIANFNLKEKLLYANLLSAEELTDEKLYREGINLYEKGEKEKALYIFVEATKLNPYVSRKILDFTISNADFQFGKRYLNMAGENIERLYPARSGVIYLNTGEKEKAFQLLFESLRYARTLSDAEVFYSQFKDYPPEKLLRPKSLAQAYALALILDDQGKTSLAGEILARFTFPFRYEEITTRLKSLKKMKLLKSFLKAYSKRAPSYLKEKVSKELELLERKKATRSRASEILKKSPRKILANFQSPLYPEAVIFTMANITQDEDFKNSEKIIQGNLSNHEGELTLFLRGINRKDRKALLKILEKYPRSPITPLVRLKLRELKISKPTPESR